MAIKIVKLKPTTAGQRHKVIIRDTEIDRGSPFKPLLVSKKRTSCRNNMGRITIERRGGGHKRYYRMVDFKRDKDGVPGVIERIEYDPNRSANIALVIYADGERRYIIAPKEVKKGMTIVSGKDAPIKKGNCLPIENIPVGSTIHCVELKPGKGAQLMRSAGTSAQLVAKEGIYAVVKMRSGEMRKILLVCRATLGEVSNTEHNLRQIGKAGANRWRGKRPTVRGTAKNPVDHPHGGGEGRTSAGRHPVSPSGVPTKGYKTRNNKRTNKMIIRDRRKK